MEEGLQAGLEGWCWHRKKYIFSMGGGRLVEGEVGGCLGTRDPPGGLYMS